MTTTNGTCTNGCEKEETDQESVILSPYRYICQLPGKQIRGKLALAFNHWLNIPSDKLGVIVEVVQQLHNSSLMIDDIEDSSTLRRGFPVAHSIYGVPMTINSANFVYFAALRRTEDLNHPEVARIFVDQMLQLHIGQGMEIHWRDTVTCPTESEYLQMVTQKTGGLFGLAVRLMQLFSTNKADLSQLWANLGIFFQIRDDYANLLSKDYADQKTYCEDLTEGKFSFPIIHAVHRNTPDSDQILYILRQKPKEYEVKRYCVDLLKRLGSLAYTRQKLIVLENTIRSQIEALGGNSHITSVLEELRNVYQAA